MKFFIFSTVAFLLLCAGCAAPQSTTVFGDPCEALTEEQFNYLIAFSRGAIKKNSAKYKITQEESNIVKNTPPRLQTEYRGNRYGTLFIIWATFPRLGKLLKLGEPLSQPTENGVSLLMQAV